MKLIIAGSRSLDKLTVSDLESIICNTLPSETVDSLTEIVSGHAKGIDQLGEQWAVKNKIPVKLFIPEWTNKANGTFNKAAGHIRNRQMGDYADVALVIMQKPGSNGSQGMIDYMNKLKKPCFVHLI